MQESNACRQVGQSYLHLQIKQIHKMIQKVISLFLLTIIKDKRIKSCSKRVIINSKWVLMRAFLLLFNFIFFCIRFCCHLTVSFTSEAETLVVVVVITV